MNTITLWEPFGMFREFDRAFGAKRELTLETDIVETGKTYEINLELSGIDKKDLTLEVKNGVLSVNGEKKVDESAEGRNYITVERSYGRFSRNFRLPEGTDEKGIKADYKNGVLTVSVPKTKTKEDKPLKIRVS